MVLRKGKELVAAVLALCATSCVESGNRDQVAAASSCMKCHNGSKGTDYAGPGIENPHPFPNADQLSCVTCHGGNDQGGDKATSHVPAPPSIGDQEFQRDDDGAWFNRLTLAGLDKVADYTVGGKTYTALDYLQFVNPGDLRVVGKGRSCGACHKPHVDKVSGSLLATEVGILSGAMFAAGVDNEVVANQGLYEDTAADKAWRALVDPTYALDPNNTGAVGELIEFPVFSVFGKKGGNNIHDNPAYDAGALPAGRDATTNRLITGSPLANLFHEQVAFTCGDCHLGSAGANNRYGDYRSSGCTACHMPYSLDGRSRSKDPNVNKLEPLDPTDIEQPERAHVRSHRIRSVKRTLANGQQQDGIDDYTCAGCHQGSNRTVMQYWGIRLDQNQDLRRGVQYPVMPTKFTNTAKDTRLFDPVVRNREFNGRNANQYILFEDYDGDNRDDTPADVHYEAGLGCIDCHGSFDLHGGDTNNPDKGNVKSRMSHAVAIKCVSCHGSATTYAGSKPGLAYDGSTKELAIDAAGQVLRHVVKEPDGHFWLTSRLTGKKHFVVQTKDTVVDSGKRNPVTDALIYNPRASYAMGRDDGNTATGIGPRQTGKTPAGFSHGDNMSCESCHSAWSNSCVGCHLSGEYNTGNNFSNITGERIVFRQATADFVYQTPVPFQLGVGVDNKIGTFSPSTKMFFKYRDRKRAFTDVFTFADRNTQGDKPGTFPALGHNAMMAHSIRGRVNSTNEGPRYCVACHMTTQGITQYGALYNTFRSQMAGNLFGSLDFDMLKDHIGKNPGNQKNSPVWVHMVAGLGSGLFLFDKDGCPQNPLDGDVDRKGCDGKAPKDNFSAAKVVYNLDRIVLDSGVSNASNNHPMLSNVGPSLRSGVGVARPNMAGPLSATMIQRLADPATGIILDSWVDADGLLGGDAGLYVK